MEDPFAKKIAQSEVSWIGRLQQVLLLAREVWESLVISGGRSVLDSTIQTLQLETSSIYATFWHDLAVLNHVSFKMPNLPETHPTWLRLQIRIQQTLSTAKDGLTVPVFDELLRVVSQLRVNTPPLAGQLDSFRNKQPRFFYVQNDYEILAFCCSLLVDYLQVHSVNRESDEYLSFLLVIIQAVAEFRMDLFRQLLLAIETRKKFSFKQFFEYIVLPEIIAEFGGMLGKVHLELRAEPATMGIAIHKTRGANRESTEALQTELLRHALMSGMHSNPFRAVQNFLKNEKESVHKVLLNSANAPLKRSSKLS